MAFLISRSEHWRSLLAPVLRIAFFLACSQAAFAGAGIEAVLRQARVESARPELTMLYNDISTFHGGTAIEIHGDGRVLRWDAQPHQPDVALQNESRMKSDELAQLLNLLVELEVWKDDSREHRRIPDESFRRLIITQDTERSYVREPYNLMQSGRFGKVYDRLEHVISKGRDLCLMPNRARPAYLRPGPVKTCGGPG
jgi:hypothetical protein